MIRITSKQHNFRRCRVAHPKGTTEYPDDTFTPEQVKVLEAEPKLTVEIVPAVAEAMAGGEQGEGQIEGTEESSSAEVPEDGEQADPGEQIEGTEEERPDLTVREIKERLEEMGVEFPPKAKKEELQQLLAEKMSEQSDTE